MSEAPHYNFRDMIGVPGRALSGKRIFVMTLFLVLALAVFDAFTYLALALTDDAGTYFSAFGLFPIVTVNLGGSGPMIVYTLGWIAALLMVMLGMFAVAAIEVETIRGNPFLSIGQSIRFASRRLGQLLTSWLTLLVFLAAVVGLFALVGLVSRIPIVGEWLYALTFLFPGFIISILTVFAILVAVISTLLLPATAAADRQGLAFNAILETFSTVLRQPVRWLGYTVYSIVAAKVCGFVYAYFCFRAVQFMVWSSGLGGGQERLRDLVVSGLAHLPTRGALARETFNVFPGLDWSFSIAPWTWGAGADSAVSYLMAAMLFVIFASIWGYTLAIVATGQARGYAVIRFHKDRSRLHEEESLFFRDEPVNPPLDQESDESTDS